MNVYFYYRNGRGDRTRTCSDLNLLFPKQVGYHLPIYTPKLNALSGRLDSNQRPPASGAGVQTRLHHALTEHSVSDAGRIVWDSKSCNPTNSRRGRSGATLLESPEHLGARSHWLHFDHIRTSSGGGFRPRIPKLTCKPISRMAGPKSLFANPVQHPAFASVAGQQFCWLLYILPGNLGFRLLSFFVLEAHLRVADAFQISRSEVSLAVRDS